jgi:Family of unknown function (DUF5906)
MLRTGLAHEIDKIVENAAPLTPTEGAAPTADDPSAVDQHGVTDIVNSASGAGAKRGGSSLGLRAASVGKATASGAPPEGPRTLGYDVNLINEEYAVVKVGGDTLIYQESPAVHLVDYKLRLMTPTAFRTWFLNRETEVRDYRGIIKPTTWANRWLRDPDRRQYEGFEFYPDRNNAVGTPGYLNLWHGFDFAPAPNPDWRRYKTFRDHLFNNVCNGDEKIYKWLFAFFAHMVQRPRERLGIALALRGNQGVGKTKVGAVFGTLFRRHWFLVDSPRYVTGNFNAHMASCLLLQADEATWAGDKDALGRLKGLITAETQFIEAKGVDPVPLPNYVRLVLTSNAGWVLPAEMDERRFVILDVHPRCAKNAAYFAQIDDEMNAGGYEHLLGDLLAVDLDKFNLRDFPKTKALLEQKFRSLNSVQAWWLERLMSGHTTKDATTWNEAVSCGSLFDDYIALSEKRGIRRKDTHISFGFELRKLFPQFELQRSKRTCLFSDGRGRLVKKRDWCYLLPPLAEARTLFDQAVEQDVEWPVEDEPGEVDNSPSVKDDDFVE